MSSEIETIEYQSHELVQGIVKDWVKNAADATRDAADELTATQAVQRMQWLYLAEPWLITEKIFDSLKLSGWAPPEGFISVDYSAKEASK